MGLRLKTAPAKSPLTLTEAKRHLAVQSDDDDAHLSRLIDAATAWVESYTGRALITQTWTYTLDEFPPCIVLPRPRLQSVSSLKYIDSDGTQQTWTSSNYRVTSFSDPAVVEPAYNTSWPTIRTVVEAIEIEFICGYGDDPDDVPENIRHAIALIIGEWDENREGMSNMRETPNAARMLLNGFKVGAKAAAAGLRLW